MITVKFENVSVKFGKKFRHNQNYTMTLYHTILDDYDVITDTDVKEVICENYGDRIYLNKQSVIKEIINSRKRVE